MSEIKGPEQPLKRGPLGLGRSGPPGGDPLAQQAMKTLEEIDRRNTQPTQSSTEPTETVEQTDQEPIPLGKLDTRGGWRNPPKETPPPNATPLNPDTSTK